MSFESYLSRREVTLSDLNVQKHIQMEVVCKEMKAHSNTICKVSLAKSVLIKLTQHQIFRLRLIRGQGVNTRQ